MQSLSVPVIALPRPVGIDGDLVGRRNVQRFQETERDFAVGGAGGNQGKPIPNCTMTFMVSTLSTTAWMRGLIPRSLSMFMTTRP